MKLKFEGQIISGRLKIYEENDMETPAYTIKVATEDNEHFKMEVKDKYYKPVGEVLYKENSDCKFLMVNEYVINNFEKNKQIKVYAERGKKIVLDENNDMCLTRSIRDRKIRFYNNNKLVMILKCKTIIKNWLRGDYTAEIFDESDVVTCVCVISVFLKVLLDEHNCISFNL